MIIISLWKIGCLIKIISLAEAISKIVDHVQGRDVNRFNNGAYTLVFEYFESVYNNALGR